MEALRGPTLLVARLDMRSRELISASKKPSTRVAYDAALRVFQQFWSTLGLDYAPFPLSRETELRFVSWLSHEHPVQSSTVQQYLSAIRSHGELISPTVTIEHVSQAIKGMAQTAASGKASVLAPTWLAAWVVAAGHKLVSLIASAAPSMIDCQSLAAVIIGFLFLSRSSTICEIRPCDFTMVGDSLVLCENYRKSKEVPVPRTLQLVVTPGSPQAALKSYLLFCEARHPLLWSVSVVSLHVNAKPSPRVDACIRFACRQVKLVHPEVEVMSSHSLRRGGAVSMLAVGVPLTMIREWGHWKGESSIRPYIEGRAFQRPTPSDVLCFGWMVRSPSGVLV